MLSETEFYDTYQPLSGPDGSDVWEYKDTLTYPLEQVWTLIDGDEDNNAYALPGYHIVNKFGYCVTAVPWEDEGIEALFIEREDDEDEEDEEEDPTLSTDVFYATYRPQRAPSRDTEVWTHAETLAYPEKQVWQIIELSDREFYAYPGYSKRWFDPAGYCVTAVPWTDEETVALFGVGREWALELGLLSE